MPLHLEGSRDQEGVGDRDMLDLLYSLVIEATNEPDYFGFYSRELEDFAGSGHSVEDCLYRAKWGMKKHVDLLREQRLPVPPVNPAPTVVIQNEPRRSVA